MFAPYKKFVVAIASFLGVTATVFADGEVTQPEGGALAVAFFGMLGVFFAKNAPE
jgi:hypothetical protein